MLRRFSVLDCGYLVLHYAIVFFLVEACDVRHATNTDQVMESHYMYGDMRYPNNIDECHRIYHDKDTDLLISFEEFDLEDSHLCKFDSLTIYALFSPYEIYFENTGITDEMIQTGEYCGKKIFKSATFRSCNFSAVFKTDDMIKRSGFRLLFRQEPMRGVITDACHHSPEVQHFDLYNHNKEDPDFTKYNPPETSRTHLNWKPIVMGVIFLGVIISIIICLVKLRQSESDNQHRERLQQSITNRNRENVQAPTCNASSTARYSPVGTDNREASRRQTSTTDAPFISGNAHIVPSAPPHSDNGGETIALRTQQSLPAYEDLQNSDDRGNDPLVDETIDTSPPPPSYEAVVANRDAYSIS